MNKILLVIQREYLVRVQKKSFLLTTIGVPIIIIIFYAIMFAIGASGGHEKNKIAVIDEARLLSGGMEKSKNDSSEYVFLTNESPDSLQANYKKLGYDYFLHIPPIDITQNVNTIKLYSHSTVAVTQKGRIERTINNAIEQKRLQSANLSREQYSAIRSDISIQNITGKEQKQGIAVVATIVAFVCGTLIYIIMLIYGTMVMRGVMEEKISRIAEVMVSSVRPFQLMMGKIVGIGAVGLTQFSIWILLLIGLRFVLAALVPGFSFDAMPAGAAPTGTGNLMAVFNIGWDAIPIGTIAFCFIFYFLGGYMLYASLFAAIGSVVSDDQSEAQQMIFPIMMPIVLGFVIMTKAAAEPNSPLVVFGSIFPLTSPVVMVGRIMYDVPISQLLLSMLLLILSVLFFVWLSAKIYRIGILMYGKKVTWKEMIKWAFRKS